MAHITIQKIEEALTIFKGMRDIDCEITVSIQDSRLLNIKENQQFVFEKFFADWTKDVITLNDFNGNTLFKILFNYNENVTNQYREIDKSFGNIESISIRDIINDSVQELVRKKVNITFE